MTRPLVTLFAAYPSRKDTARILAAIEQRGYLAQALGPNQTPPQETAKVAILSRNLTAADERRIRARAVALNVSAFVLPAEESREVWERHLPSLVAKAAPEAPEPPPPSISRKVEPAELDEFLHAVKSGLEAGAWEDNTNYTPAGWEAVLVLLRHGTLWKGPSEPAAVQAYVERLWTTPEKLPAWFREWWPAFQAAATATPLPAVEKERPDDLGPVDVGVPALERTELTTEELLPLYTEAEAQISSLHQSLVSAEQTVLRQARELETVHAKHRGSLQRVAELAREVCRLRNRDQANKDSLDELLELRTRQAKQTEALAARVQELEAEVTAWKARPPALEIPPGGRLLSADDIASCRLAMTSSIFTPEDILKKLLGL